MSGLEIGSSWRIRQATVRWRIRVSLTCLNDDGNGMNDMPVDPQKLIEYGYRPIRSWAQADQLLRRELKHHRQWQQRTGRTFDCQRLLKIKPGNWFSIMKRCENAGLVIWVVRK